MATKHALHEVALSDKRNLKTLIENRKAFTLQQCELNVFETYTTTHLVPLTFNNFVVTSMLRGKKVMHLFEQSGFDYMPGESVIVPANVTMRIDFPEAHDKNPTQCIALAIDHAHIQETLDYLNERFPKTDQQSWQLDASHYHFLNNEEVTYLINKLIAICSSYSLTKDILADLTLKELLVRIMQTQNLAITNASYTNTLSNNPMAYVLGFIKANIHHKIQIDQLSSMACMSKSTFHRSFKRELGLSPLEYIMIEKIGRAKQLLSNPTVTASSVSHELGFSDLNYFIRTFKKMEGITPRQYQFSLRH